MELPLTVPRPAIAAKALRSPTFLQLGARQLWRDFRAGELRLLAVAVMLAVTALCAVGFFADRLSGGLSRDARQLLGGDAVVSADRPLPDDVAAQARSLGLRLSTDVSFPSMARAEASQGGATRLVAVKAVSAGYPLRGQLRVAPSPDAPDVAIAGGPAPGTAWVDAAVLESLALKVGDPVLVGDARLRIDRVIVIEPDRGGGFTGFSPRLMFNEADLAATNLVQPASRLNYRLAVAASDAPGSAGDAAVRRFVTAVKARIDGGSLRGASVDSLDGGRPEMRQTLDRAEKFLNLVALLAALLAAVAVALASRDFAGRHLDDCAVLRVLGLSQRKIAGAYLVEFGAVGLGASLIGVALGYGVHFVFVAMLSGLVNASLPAASVWPALFGLGVGLTLLVAFGVPPVLQLAQVPALRVIRRDVGGLRPASLLVLGAGAAGFVALLLAVSSDLTLGLIAVGGFAAAVALFAGTAWLAVGALKHAIPSAWMSQRAPRWLVLATRQVAARPAFAVLQVSALSVGLLALILLVLLRTDLVDSWRSATPADAPNRFVINIQPEQGDAFKASLTQAGVKQYDWYPMIRGRLVAINGADVVLSQYAEGRARRMVDREFNLSHSAALPAKNEVVGGRWQPDEADAISVEAGLAETLGLKLGDRLRFDVAGSIVESRITSLRKVDWGSMRANFFVLFPRAQMSDLPASYIAAFRAPAGGTHFDSTLSRDFPNITTVDVSATIAQLQRVIGQVIGAVEFLFAFTLAAGLVVLFAAVTSTREARAHEFAVMRALGAGSTLLSRVQRAELLGLGALAGFLASLAAMAVGWGLARYAFEFDWHPALWVPLAGAAAGGLLALAAGWWGLRGVLRRPVMDSLRAAVVN